MTARTRRRTVAEHSSRRSSVRRSTTAVRTVRPRNNSVSPGSLPSTERNTAPADCRRNGQCAQRLRVMSLTAAGLLHSHGPGCSGSGKEPVEGSVACVTLHSHRIAQSSTAAINTPASPIRTSVDIMELLRHRRVRVLKRVPKSSRIPAAEKLGETLRQVIDNPDCVDKWLDLLSFTFSCFGVPGQRGGKRHISSLASKINAAVASFPSTSPAVRHPPQPTKLRQSPDNMTARV